MQKIENKELADLAMARTLAASSYRQARDHEIAGWRDMIHNAMLETPVPNFKLLHEVMNAMDKFLNTSKHSPLTD